MSRQFDDVLSERQHERGQSILADELGLTLEELDSIPLDVDSDIETNTGNSGDMPYNYYFYVPESTPEEILLKKEWSVGDVIELPINLFDEPDDN